MVGAEAGAGELFIKKAGLSREGSSHTHYCPVERSCQP